MRLFSIADDLKLTEYKEKDFKEDNNEELLERWLEANPECIMEEQDLLIIGRQVTTNLGSIIDLLGLDRQGNTVVVELKRDRTPRETLAQLLEYASFVEDLSYEDLQDVYNQYSGEDGGTLLEQHRYHFKLGEDEGVSFNKDQKLVIVGQSISKEIAQTSSFLRKKGLDVLCLEFKYFKTKSGEEVIATDFVIGQDVQGPKRVTSGSQSKTSKLDFLSKLTSVGRPFFEQLLQFADTNQLWIEWGAKGFSLRVNVGAKRVSILYGYPPGCYSHVESIYTACAEILKNVAEPELVVESYQVGLDGIDGFVHAGSGPERKYVFTKEMTQAEEERFLNVLSTVVDQVKTNGLKG